MQKEKKQNKKTVPCCSEKQCKIWLHIIQKSNAKYGPLLFGKARQKMFPCYSEKQCKIMIIWKAMQKYARKKMALCYSEKRRKDNYEENCKSWSPIIQESNA